MVSGAFQFGWSMFQGSVSEQTMDLSRLGCFVMEIFHPYDKIPNFYNFFYKYYWFQIFCLCQKAAMQKFTTMIVNKMKSERLYESQGGPIILSQVIKNLFIFIYLFVVFLCPLNWFTQLWKTKLWSFPLFVLYYTIIIKY